jgi:hypothetical protein
MSLKKPTRLVQRDTGNSCVGSQRRDGPGQMACSELRRRKFRIKAGSRLDQICRMRSSDNEAVVVDYGVRNKFDSHNIPYKEEPSSIFKVDQLYQSLAKYSGGVGYRETSGIRNAINDAYRVFGKPEHQQEVTILRDEYDIYKNVDLSKGSGIHCMSKLEAWDFSWIRHKEILDGTKKPEPCLFGVRTQSNKTRLVWQYPLSMIIVETMVGQPIIREFNVRKSPFMGGYLPYERGSVIMSAGQRARSSVAIDFSGFDQTVPAELIKVAFRILKTWAPSFEYWDLIINYFIHTPIVMPDGFMYLDKHRGIPSGSLFTQLIGSIVNWILVRSAQHEFFEDSYLPHPLQLLVVGDDSIFFTNQVVDLVKWEAYFASLGMRLNRDKSIYSNDGQRGFFLGVDWRSGVPYRITRDPLKKAVYPEKPRKRGLDWREEEFRVMSLILTTACLGVNTYEDLSVFWRSPTDAAKFRANFIAVTGLQEYVQEYVDPTLKRTGLDLISGMWRAG